MSPTRSLFVFDVVPPRQYVGARAYRKDWEDFFASFSGPVETFEINDLNVVTNGNLGFSHSIQRVVFTDKDGKKTDITFRLTDVYRKVNGKWLIVHEHVSVPVDLATGKADLSSKP
jgi:ketosteroid isomerase-like protein